MSGAVPRMRMPERRLRAEAGVRVWALAAYPGCLAAIALLAPTAWAQPDPPMGAPASSAAAVDQAPGANPSSLEAVEEPGEPEEVDPSSPDAVEDFLVTASKLEFAVPDSTISVIGFDPEELKAEGINDIRDIAKFTPGL